MRPVEKISLFFGTNLFGQLRILPERRALTHPFFMKNNALLSLKAHFHQTNIHACWCKNAIEMGNIELFKNIRLLSFSHLKLNFSLSIILSSIFKDICSLLLVSLQRKHNRPLQLSLGGKWIYENECFDLGRLLQMDIWNEEGFIIGHIAFSRKHNIQLRRICCWDADENEL